MKCWWFAAWLASGCSFTGGSPGASVGHDGGADTGGPGDAIGDGHALDGRPIDALTQTCASETGLLAGLCAMPASDVTIPGGTFDTGTDPSCSASVATLCVVLGHTITVAQAVTVQGSRPLVLFASGTITISGSLDASSTFAGAIGAAADSTDCGAPSTTPSSSTNGAGAGAGGSFGSAGANGGNGNKNGTNHAGGVAGAAAGSLAHVRGGCPGQDGASGGTGGRGGHGGGAIYVFSATSIVSSGTLFASGAGGGGGDTDGGGGGGGAGGLIGLEAPSIMMSGRIAANGGGGGGGGGLFDPTTGGPGDDGTTTNQTAAAQGGAPGFDTAGGGQGTAISIAPVTPAIENGGGGGGGGGLGIVWVKGTLNSNGQISPAPTQN